VTFPLVRIESEFHKYQLALILEIKARVVIEAAKKFNPDTCVDSIIKMAEVGSLVVFYYGMRHKILSAEINDCFPHEWFAVG